MIIAQIIGDLRIGGAERLFVDLANGLSGNQVYVVLLNNEYLVKPNLARKLNPTIRVIASPVRQRSFFIDLPRLAGLLRRLKCDVVHTHMFWASLYGSIAAKMAGVPVTVTSEHGRNEWKRSQHKWLETKVITPLSTMRLCVSQDILERRRDSDGISESKLILVPNATKVPEELRRTITKEVVIGSVGRLVPEKDYPALVRAFAEVRKTGIDCRLEIVGEGSARKDIQKQIDAVGLNQYIDLVGAQDDVGKWLRRWSVFAMSSKIEGQPISLLEAMAHGLPCVATKVGGIPDTLENRKEGLIVEAGNEKALAAAIAELVVDAELRKTLGRAARQRVIREFSIDALTERCTEIYQQALASKRI